MKEITLVSVKGELKTFPHDHALNLMRRFKTWSLPVDSEIKFIDNEFVRNKPNKADSRKKTSEGSNSDGDSTSGEA
jgi:hypothetical protein